MSGLTARNSPDGEVRTDSLEMSFEGRFSKGFSFYVGYTHMRDDDARARRGSANWVFGGWQLGVVWEAQSGALLDSGTCSTMGTLRKSTPGSGRSTVGANFERSSSKAPASFHDRVFPTRIDGLRADPTNVNRTQFAAPDTNPLSSNFAKVTLQSQTNKRYLQITGRITF
ncbi:MAG TPA: hypothetical protein VN442_04975 [Bryobacteraceae bacterium]|nr:hypothetical protein [Bryobacteraceae bacterium]